jgi:hypothetical protein
MLSVLRQMDHGHVLQQASSIRSKDTSHITGDGIGGYIPINHDATRVLTRSCDEPLVHGFDPSIQDILYSVLHGISCLSFSSKRPLGYESRSLQRGNQQ